MVDSRQRLEERLWELTGDGLKGYGDMIDRLMAYMTVEQLREVVTALEGEE